MTEIAQITFVDDHTEELGPLSNLINQSGVARSEVYMPSDIDDDVLKRSDLIVVDYSLDAWIDNVPGDQLSLRPINGVALASVLRQHCRRLKDYPPTGFALITGQIENLGPNPEEVRHHVISRLNNVEWFFEKGKKSVNDHPNKVISLAAAIKMLPTSLQTELSNIDGLMDFLGAGESDLRLRFVDSVRRCRPPIHHLAERRHGLLVLRWLLQRILPHTTFLIDQRTLASRLYIDPDTLSGMKAADALYQLFEPNRYTGPLSDFDGNRWWRDGIEQSLWNITNGESANSKAIHTALSREGIRNLEPVDLVRPVVTLNSKLISESALSSADDVLPIHLDDWPSYAEPAYIRKAEIEKHPKLQMYVANNFQA